MSTNTIKRPFYVTLIAWIMILYSGFFLFDLLGERILDFELPPLWFFLQSYFLQVCLMFICGIGFLKGLNGARYGFILINLLMCCISELLTTSYIFTTSIEEYVFYLFLGALMFLKGADRYFKADKTIVEKEPVIEEDARTRYLKALEERKKRLREQEAAIQSLKHMKAKTKPADSDPGKQADTIESVRKTAADSPVKVNLSKQAEKKIKRKYDYAVYKIQRQDYKGACGELRLLLEKYIIEMCERYEIREPNLSAMIHKLHEKNILDKADFETFMRWKRWGDSGVHDGNEQISKDNALQFLNGVASLTGHRQYVAEISSSAESY